MLRQLLLGTPILIGLSCALLAAAAFHSRGSSSQPVADQDVDEEFHRIIPMSANGSLSLENSSGDILIKTWDRNEIKIDAVKSAPRKERLAEAQIEIDPGPDVVRIKTKYANENLSWGNDDAHRQSNPASVSYTLTVPGNTRIDKIELLNGTAEIDGVAGGIKASSVNAGFTLRNIVGVVDISTVNGRLEAILEPRNKASSVVLSAVNGQIVLSAAADANVQVKAYTMNGQIKNDFGFQVNRTVGSYLTGSLGSAGAKIDLRNLNGGITLRRN
jgi:DUF4097 and DUF4098 domain-containing protein YvlB